MFGYKFFVCYFCRAQLFIIFIKTIKTVYGKFIFIFAFIFCAKLSSQVIEPVGDMYDPRLQSFVIANTTFQRVIKNRSFDTIDLDTIFSGEFYRFRMRLADNSTRISFQSDNLPKGMKVAPDGTIQGITYDQGLHYIALDITYDTAASRGILKMHVSGEPMHSHHKLLDSLFFYPNPFREKLNLEFYVDKPHRVAFKVFNDRGELVRIINNERYRKGYHHITWDARDNQGERLDDGWYRIQFSVFDRKNFVVTDTRRVLKMTRGYQRFW